MGNTQQLRNTTIELQNKKWKYCSQIKDSPTGKVSELFYASNKPNFKTRSAPALAGSGLARSGSVGAQSGLDPARAGSGFKQYHKCWEYSVIFSSWKKMIESDNQHRVEMNIKEQLKSELNEYYKSKNYFEDENAMWNDEETGDLVYETMRKIGELSRKI